ncbi:MAG: HyaD/HybD family hydrogenase maturation endopeptidase [Anaerolineaceae bacterium]
MGSTTLILGVGNYLQSDDGVSVHTLEYLMINEMIPSHIHMVDGGTCGLDLLQYLEGVENLILVDAVHAGKEPGTIIRIESDRIPAYLAMKMSPHDIGLPDLLATAKLRDIYPSKVVVLGIEPESVQFGVELSDTIYNKIPEFAEAIKREAIL